MNTYTAFAVATLERAVKTFAQVLAALLVADGTGIVGTAWTDRLSVAGMAAVISVLTSVASAPFGGAGPSLANEATSPPAVEPSDAGATVIEACYVVITLSVVAMALVALFGRP